MDQNTPVFLQVNQDKNHKATLLFGDEHMLHVGDFVEEEKGPMHSGLTTIHLCPVVQSLIKLILD